MEMVLAGYFVTTTGKGMKKTVVTTLPWRSCGVRKGEGRDLQPGQETFRPSKNPSAVCGAKTRLLLGRSQQEKLNCTVQTGPESEDFKFTCKRVSCDSTEEASKRLSVLLDI